MGNKYDSVMQRIGFRYIGEEKHAVSAEEIERCERVIGHALPLDYKVFLSEYGRTTGRGITRFGNLDNPAQEESSIEVFYGLRPGDKYDLLGNRDVFGDGLPANLLPIASSSGGEIVLSLSGENAGNVYWWSPHRGSANPYDDLELIAYSFDSFVNSLRTHAD